MHAVTNAYVGLGSNLGDRLANLSAAIRRIERIGGVEVMAVSHVYESEPWGVEEQPPFANAVALLVTNLDAETLLDALGSAEHALGRVRGERYGPRVIDLDLLLFGDEERATSLLTLPHPRLMERDFVVTPLLELDPEVRLPDGRRVAEAEAAEGRVRGVLGVIPGYGDRTPRPHAH